MQISRRSLIVLAGAAVACGCSSETAPSPERMVTRATGPVDAGPASSFAAPGVYRQFSDRFGFYIVRQGDDLYAISSICTHRECKVNAVEGGFKCRCHGSTFTLEGHVTRGPARRDLPRWSIERDQRDHLIVHPPV